MKQDLQKLRHSAFRDQPVEVLVHLLGIIGIYHRQGVRSGGVVDKYGDLAGLVLSCYITLG